MEKWEETGPIPRVLTTAVGSMPHSIPSEGVELVMSTLHEAPHAPQFTRTDPREQMWIQYTEGLPRFQVDVETLTYRFDTSGDTAADLETFYAGYLEAMEGGSLEPFAISRDYGSGIHTFLDRLREKGDKLPFVKLQVTGPLSFATTVTDENGKPIFYHPEFRDVAVKGMGLKAMWLIDVFREFADNVILFFDEPSLSAYGSSAFLGVSEADVVQSLDEVTSMVLQKGGIPGVHCCGNTDWALLMKTSTRIINFDAVNFMDSMPIYAEQLRGFLERGGVLAWGAVGNTEVVEEETPETVKARITYGMKVIGDAGVDREILSRKLMITPACGCGGLSVERVALVYRLLSQIEEMGERILDD